MADENDPKNDPPATGTEGGDGAGGSPDPEEAFWAKFEGRLSATVNKLLDEREKAAKKNQPPATSRAGGHPSLPTILAKALGGPFWPTGSE